MEGTDNNRNDLSGLDYLKLLFNSGGDHLYQKLTDLFPAIIYIFDAETRKLRFINKKITDILGYTYEDVKAWDNDLMKAVFQDDVETVTTELEKFYALQDNDFHSYNSRLVPKEGAFRYFKTQGTILRRKENGHPDAILFIAQDITEQLASSEELSKMQELMNETEEMLHYGVYKWDITKDEVFWSNGLCRIFETENGQQPLNAKEFQQYITDEDRERVQQHIEKTIKDKTGYEIEYEIKTNKENIKIIRSKAKVVLDDKEEVIKLIGTLQDITQIKMNEKELEKHLKELDRSNKELEEFAYIASHDMQEPLRKIITFSSRLQTQHYTSLNKEGMLYLNRIMASADNMRALIDNLLEFSLTSRSNQPFEEIDLNDIVSKAQADLELLVEETSTTIIKKNLPVIEVIPSLMLQLFINLFSNSIKFRSPHESPVIKIKAALLSDREKKDRALLSKHPYYKITVEDNGIGFEEEYAARIFQIFQRLHGKAEYPGSGIGLAICYKIIEKHNGVLFASGEPGQGATFTIILPQKQ